MRAKLINKLKRAFDLYDDLIGLLSDENLKKKLPGLRSNEIGQQLWCVIGARNSYLSAMKAGKWVGFDCPLKWDDTGSNEMVKLLLRNSSQETLDFLESGISFPDEILIDLLEHEVQHHGQLIRYLYGLEIEIPVSWKKRYSLD